VIDRDPASLADFALFRECEECPELVVIPAGSFVMGAPRETRGRGTDEFPPRTVQIRRFAIGRFEVSAREWSAFAQATSRPPRTQRPRFAYAASHPVVFVTWHDAQAYVQWLSERTGASYRLLTEAEWEYAARAGTATPFPWGAQIASTHANYKYIVSNFGLGTQPVGSYPPNPFGLFDMHGNVAEWVEDCYRSHYIDAPLDGGPVLTAPELPLGGHPCTLRVIRGGGHNTVWWAVRSHYRADHDQGGATDEIGFRVARTIIPLQARP
jgi:formylglycine-generating enzyme required for sulfatase activity